MARWDKGNANPADWDAETGEWVIATLCVPNSLEWQVVLETCLNTMTTPRFFAWGDGAARVSADIARIIERSLTVDCDNNLGRIANSLESIRGLLGPSNPEHTIMDYMARLEVLGDTGYGATIRDILAEIASSAASETMTLEDILDSMESVGVGDVTDLIEIIRFLGGLLPGFPDIKIPVSDIMSAIGEWRFRQAIISNLDDISASQRIQATAQFGPSATTLYEVLPDLVSAPTGFVQTILWLWKRLSYEDTPSWTTWVNTVISWLKGDIVGHLKTIADNVWAAEQQGDVSLQLSAIVENLATIAGNSSDPSEGLNGIIDELQALVAKDCSVTCEPDVTVNCGGVGSAGTYPSGGGTVDSEAAPDLDLGGDPPSGFGGWAEYDAYKCQAADLQIHVVIGFFNWLNSVGSLIIGAETGAAVGTLLIAAFNSAAAAWAAAVGYSAATEVIMAGIAIYLAPAWVTGLVITAIASVVVVAGAAVFWVFDTIAVTLDSTKGDVLCDLYNATTVAEAKSILGEWIGSAISSLTVEEPYDAYEVQILSMLTTIAEHLVSTSFANLLFSDDDRVKRFSTEEDCESCPEGLCPAQVIYGSITSDITDEGVRTIDIDSQGIGPVQVIGISSPGYEYPDGNGVCGWHVVSVAFLSSTPPYSQYRRFDYGGDYLESTSPISTDPNLFFQGRCLQYAQIQDEDVFSVRLVLSACHEE